MSPRGRKPTPTTLKLVKGNPGRRKISKKEPAPQQTKKVPAPPDHLTPGAKTFWRKMAPILHAQQLLTDVDLVAFAQLAIAHDRWVESEKKVQKYGELITFGRRGKGKDARPGTVQVSPYLAVANRAYEQLRRMLAEFGMTPSARSRIEVDQPPPDDGVLS